ncbi:MAG: hypothetical protein GF355_16225 [Candidatus Eisenbacteria bacterium]|nr:hypothetical protein [Candidatus Eisenbacteria bacterium]
MHKRLLRPERLRRIPRQFSWIDHRLVRERYLEPCHVEARALYLFLVTVGDARGLSYYSDAALSRHLYIDRRQLKQARRELIAADLVAFEPPLYQVLSLDDVSTMESQRPRMETKRVESARTRSDGLKRVSEILRDLEARP